MTKIDWNDLFRTNVDGDPVSNYKILNETVTKYKEEFIGFHDFADTKKENGLDISAEFGYGEYTIVPDDQEQEDRRS